MSHPQQHYGHSSPSYLREDKTLDHDCTGNDAVGCHKYIPYVFNQVQERVMVTGDGTRRRHMNWTTAWCLSLPNSASRAISKTVMFPVGLKVAQVYLTSGLFLQLLFHCQPLFMHPSSCSSKKLKSVKDHSSLVYCYILWEMYY